MPRVSPRRATSRSFKSTTMKADLDIPTSPGTIISRSPSPESESSSLIKAESTSPHAISPVVQLQQYDESMHGSYMDYVKAKRQRNESYMASIGLAAAANDIRSSVAASKATQRGISASRKKARLAKSKSEPARRSPRVAGVSAPAGFEVTSDSGGKIKVAGSLDTQSNPMAPPAEVQHFDGRINDGEDVHFSEEYHGYDEDDDEETKAGADVSKGEVAAVLEGIAGEVAEPKAKKAKKAKPPSTSFPARDIDATIEYFASLNVNDESRVAKVTKERIYAMEMAPTPHKIIVAAGDKWGNVGLWDTSNPGFKEQGVVMSKPHSSVVTHLEFKPDSSKMLSVSYDSTVRELDVETGVYSQVFGTYDTSDLCEQFKGSASYGIDGGQGYFVQYGCYDAAHNGVYMTTSKGQVLHYDCRADRVTFNTQVSNKKLNSFSLSGDLFAVGGLEKVVRVFDIRKFSKKAWDGKKPSKQQKPVAFRAYGGSINSAFFSPSGGHLLTTCMNDTLTLTPRSALSGSEFCVGQTIQHNNHTGRWLSTFMARWHPSMDFFAVGCMKQPRRVQFFGADQAAFKLKAEVKGDYVTAVCSRNCMHRTEAVAAGGNASGRVIIIK